MTVVKAQDDSQIRLRAELDALGDRLHAEFDAAVGADMVASQLTDVVNRLDNARILTYLPVLIERETRRSLQRLQSNLSVAMTMRGARTSEDLPPDSWPGA